MRLQSFIPKPIKLFIKRSIRLLQDIGKGEYQRIARKKTQTNLPIRFSIKQVIKKSYLYENKLHNLALAGERIAEIKILPKQIFSFWSSVKAPSPSKGYKKGRNIINGVLSEDYGGGLCQISGLLYHLALTAGLGIKERYPHSLDVYKDNERYTPLGADATVVFGYKDLRIENTLDSPIQFSFEITNHQFIGHFHCINDLEKKSLVFKRKDENEKRIIRTFVDGKEWVGESVYRVEIE